MNKAFTLIELLVVITIIGILSSVVLVQFPGAVKKAKDGRVVSDMSQIRTRSAIIFANRESYADVYCEPSGDTCINCKDETIERLCIDIEQNISPAEDLVIYINDDDQGFCAVAHLWGSGKYFCVDGELHSKEYLPANNPLDGPCDSSCKAANNCRCE